MKTDIIISCFGSIAMLVFAVIILKGHGDNLINNFQRLTDEEKAHVNVLRMRILTASLLALVAILLPLNVIATTDIQHLAIVIGTAIVVVVHLVALRFWAGVPLFRTPRKK